MSRIITADRVAQIEAARQKNPEALGPMLAELIIEGNIPVEGVAAMLSVSHPTIYRWMYGDAEPRDADKINKIKKLNTILRKAKRAKDTPIYGTTKVRVELLAGLVFKHRVLKGGEAKPE